MITIVMPVSRDTYLKKIFNTLENLDTEKYIVNILCIVDGNANLFTTVRNYVEGSKFDQRLTVQFKSKHTLKHFDVMARRMRIADIHNEIKKHIKQAEYIFGIEDDTIIPRNALVKLMKAYLDNPHAGMIEGVELGRWGVPYVGAWKCDDIYNPSQFKSLKPKDGIEEIDAGGFYCFMTKAEVYMAHTFAAYHGLLGPDVNYGMWLRQQGYMNYIHWGVQCIHKHKGGDIDLSNTEAAQIEFTYSDQSNRWLQKVVR